MPTIRVKTNHKQILKLMIKQYLSVSSLIFLIYFL